MKNSTSIRFLRFICLLLILFVSLSGCVGDFFHSWDATFGYYKPVAFDEMEYTHPDLIELQNLLDIACARSQDADSVEGVISAVQDFNVCYDSFFTNYALANIHYCTDLTNTYWQNEYNYCAEAEPTFYESLEKLYKALAQSPFRQELEQDIYFGADYFDAYESDGLWNSTFLRLSEEETALINQYYALTDRALDYEAYSEAYYSEFSLPMAELLAQLVAVRQEIAAYAGYSDYVEYAYAYQFARDYSPEQVEQYLQQVRSAFYDLYVQTDTSLLWQDALAYCSEEDTFLYVSDAANAMGGSVKEAFEVLSKNRLYDIAYQENKFPSSFELYLWSYYSPYIFLSPYGEQTDKLTFAHEFGHFASDYLCYGSYAGTDIAEVHSQAFEYLSLCYNKDAASLTQLKTLDSLCIYMECAAYTLFEHELYRLTGEDLTAESILDLYTQIGQQFGFDNDYWDPREFVTVTHFFTDPLYNISYVVSNDLALQFYEMEQIEKGSGLELYQQCLLDEGSYLLTFAETYQLESPFTDGRPEQIADIFRSILFP